MAEHVHEKLGLFLHRVAAARHSFSLPHSRSVSLRCLWVQSGQRTPASLRLAGMAGCAPMSHTWLCTASMLLRQGEQASPGTRMEPALPVLGHHPLQTTLGRNRSPLAPFSCRQTITFTGRRSSCGSALPRGRTASTSGSSRAYFAPVRAPYSPHHPSTQNKNIPKTQQSLNS